MNWLSGLLSIGININYDSGNRNAPEVDHSGFAESRAKAEALARAIRSYRNAANAGAKYRLNQADKELIGIQDAVLFWASESGVDNSTDDDGNSGLHLTTFDTTTRADSAKIDLLNDSGIAQYVVAAAIKAKPVVRLSGEQGFVQDSFVDYQDIFLSGENLFEFGNNFVVTKVQLEQLADYYAKALGVIVGDSAAIRSKHIYSVTIPGRCWWFEPGEWYTLQVGGAGQREYIDSVCECYGVQVEASADGLGTTRVDFREVEQNWVKDSNAVARFLATGDPRWKPNNFGRVVVAARDYMGTADYYCDGTADQTEIQAALNFLANGFGGGVVQLTEGQFNTTAKISLYENIILRGSGSKTIISKNCNDYAIEASGAFEKVALDNLKITRNAADTNLTTLVGFANVLSSSIIDCVFDDFYGGAIALFSSSNNNLISRNLIKNGTGGLNAVILTGGGQFINNLIYDNKATGISLSADAAQSIKIAHNHIINNYGDGIVLVESGGTIAIPEQIENNYIFNNAQFESGTVVRGINILFGNRIQVKGNICKDNGTLIDLGFCESATPPAASGEVTNTLTQCTYARSDVQEYEGSYSYLLTKTVAAGTASTAYLTDSAATDDMHGLYAGQEYRFGAWVYIPAGGMLGTELSLVIRDYVPAAWVETAVACANTYDAWQYVEVTRTLRATATGATFGFSVAAAAADTETAYTDNLRLTPMGTGNLHNQNFYDAGTNTYTGV